MTALREAWAEALVEAAAADTRILLLDGDLANSTKADLFAERLPDRFLQMGIAEQNMVGVAAGLADWNYVPWVSSFAVFFSHRALDQIRMLVAQTDANVKIAAAYAGLLTGASGKTHQDLADLAIFRAMPGMTILSPADRWECAAMIGWANEYSGPVYLRLARDPSSDVFDAGYRFRIDAVRELRRGDDVVLVSTGVQTTRVLEAADLLAGHGHDVGVVHVPVIKPLDPQRLVEVLAPYSTVVTVEEHNVVGGLGGLVAETLSATASPPTLLRLGIEDRWGESASNDELLEHFGLSAGSVATRVLAAVSEPDGTSRPAASVVA